jgi:hypothetical protein
LPVERVVEVHERVERVVEEAERVDFLLQSLLFQVIKQHKQKLLFLLLHME